MSVRVVTYDWTVVPPPWRPYLDFGGSDLEEERFHGPIEVDDSEETVAQQSANENGLAEAYRVDALRSWKD